MAIVRKIAEPIEPDWRKSPVMIKLMAMDKKRCQKAIADYEKKKKKKAS